MLVLFKNFEDEVFLDYASHFPKSQPLYFCEQYDYKKLCKTLECQINAVESLLELKCSLFFTFFSFSIWLYFIINKSVKFRIIVIQVCVLNFAAQNIARNQPAFAFLLFGVFPVIEQHSYSYLTPLFWSHPAFFLLTSFDQTLIRSQFLTSL